MNDFYFSDVKLPKAVMTLSKDGVWVDPDLPVDQAAELVLKSMDEQIKRMISVAVAEEREACAKIVDDSQDGITFIGDRHYTVASAIRMRGLVTAPD